MIRIMIAISIIFCTGLFAEEMTVDKFKKILKEKESKTIRKELKVFPIFKKARVKMDFKYSDPDKESFTAFSKGEEKYLAGKYILTIYYLPDGNKLHSIMLWNDKKKVIEAWFMSFKEEISKTNIKKSEKKDRFLTSGNTADGGSFKGYTDYSKKLISWETKYYDKDGKLTFSVSGNAVPVE